MTLKVYLDGTNTGIGPDDKVVEGGIIYVAVPGWRVGVSAIVAVASRVGILAVVFVGWRVGTLVGISV